MELCLSDPPLVKMHGQKTHYWDVTRSYSSHPNTAVTVEIQPMLQPDESQEVEY